MRQLTRALCTGVAPKAAVSEGALASSGSAQGAFKPPVPAESTKTSLVFSIADEPGALMKALATFHELEVNISRLESKPNVRDPRAMDMIVDVEGTTDGSKNRVSDAVKRLRALGCKAQVIGSPEVPWFPRGITELDDVFVETAEVSADGGDGDITSDHPGFTDAEYRRRRSLITQNALAYKTGDEIPRVEYSKEENETWGTVYRQLKELYPLHACEQFNSILPLMERYCGYSDQGIPQLEDISQFLNMRSGFTLRPVAGLLSARQFLNALAFRVFYSTQYIRHHSKPLYTPEPDVVHELMGHAPMFADAEFADFSHEIGMASLGASDQDVERLATCYWFTVEFGLCYQRGQLKAYGAGLLSSIDELEHAMSEVPDVRAFDPFAASTQDYPITEVQPVYFASDSFVDARLKLAKFAESQRRPFAVRYDATTQSISLDRDVVRGNPLDSVGGLLMP
jgi:phenylalanine-4-hydroxylase